MNKLIWTLQVLLAVVFLAHGIMLLNPPAEYVEMMNAQLGVGFRLFLGVAEVLAAIGLIAPGVTRILPWLTQLAAAGVMIVMVAATVMHLVRAEYSSALTTTILLAMATFVAYQRWKIRPIAPRAQPVLASS
ncbi:MAG TPA: DoxX family protein [Herpetosiphonaceae bacterium]